MNSRLLAVFLIALALRSCAYVPPVSEDEKGKLEIIGDHVTKEHVNCINEALSYLPKEFRKSLEKVHLRDDLEHFEFSYNGTKHLAIGHHCTGSSRKVCLRPDHLTHALVWHEIAHVYTYAHDQSLKLEREWLKTAGNVYTDYYEDYSGETSSDGLLTRYSRRNYLEDIAEQVESCYFYLYINNHYWVFDNENLKKDKRYRRKLALLCEYGFLSSEDYKKLKPLFE